MKYETLRFERSGEVATITFARHEKRNAISACMIDELIAALDQAEAANSRAVIITGEGKAFCAGMDLEDLQRLAQQSPAQNLEDSRRMARMFLRIRAHPQPVIAAVNGAAIAGGCGIATLADFTLAVPEAKFGYSEVRIGFLPALVSVFLRQQIGEKQARKLLLTGVTIDAAEAHRIGLITEIVPAASLGSRAGELANSLLAASPSSIKKTKKLLSRFEEETILQQIELAIQENAEIRATADFREGVASFLEKRLPRWTGK
jgi:methylglutaconyl-CoA hydratase